MSDDFDPSERRASAPASHEPAPREPKLIRWQDMTWKDYVRIGLGLAFFVLGVLGLILPILQGVLFLIASAFLLAPYSRWVQKQLDRAEKRFPWLATKARAITQRWTGKNDAG